MCHIQIWLEHSVYVTAVRRVAQTAQPIPWSLLPISAIHLAVTSHPTTSLSLCLTLTMSYIIRSTSITHFHQVEDSAQSLVHHVAIDWASDGEVSRQCCTCSGYKYSQRLNGFKDCSHIRFCMEQMPPAHRSHTPNNNDAADLFILDLRHVGDEEESKEG